MGYTHHVYLGFYMRFSPSNVNYKTIIRSNFSGKNQNFISILFLFLFSDVALSSLLLHLLCFHIIHHINFAALN